jgi:hypothetical protein
LKCIGLGTQMESILLWDWKSVSVCVYNLDSQEKKLWFLTCVST